MKQKLTAMALLLIMLSSLMGMQAEKKSILDHRLNMQVHPAETLESVIFRIQAQTGKPIGFTTVMLMPYKPTAADYKDKSISDILSQQLAGTPLAFRLKRKRLVLYLKDAVVY